MVGQAGSSGANGSSRRVRLLYRCRLIRKDCGGYAVNSSRGVRQPSANRLPTATIQSRQVPTAYTAGPVEPSRLPRMRPTLMPAGDRKSVVQGKSVDRGGRGMTISG